MSNSLPYHQQLDTRGLQCPMPLLKTKLALNTLSCGQVLNVLATDSASWRDIHAYIELTSHELISASDVNNHYQYWIKKGP